MLTAHPLLSSARIESLGEAPALPPVLDAEIERLWQAEQVRRGRALFNGYILSATEVSPKRVAGRRAEYRRLIAQRLRPELFETLCVRPVAVSGLLRCADGVVLGLRAQSTVQHAGQWELVPSGSVDPASLDGPGLIDIRNQILNELNEEVGLGPDVVTEAAPFCLIEDQESRVLDIGIALSAPALTAEVILQAHHLTDGGEYDELAVIPQQQLNLFVERMGCKMVSVSRMLLSLKLEGASQI